MPTSGQFAVGELVTSSDANSLFVRGYRNRIINGAFVINQRGYTSGTNLASGSYGFDRWKSGFTNTALTFTAGSQSTTVTISSSGVLQQIIERENIPAGNYILSFSGTATGRVYNSGGSAPAYAASPILVTIDGTANVVVEFTASGGTKTLGTVQLEAGSVFSPFEYRFRSEELALCQRYYEKFEPNAYAYTVFGGGLAGAVDNCVNLSTFKVTKRDTPSSIDVVGSMAIGDNNGVYTIYTLSLFLTVSSKFQGGTLAITPASLTTSKFYWLLANNNSTASLAFNSEL